jgi:hypothetical protein
MEGLKTMTMNLVIHGWVAGINAFPNERLDANVG